MDKRYITILFFVASLFSHGQLHHQGIASVGTTSVNDNFIVSQSIGQLSVIGNKSTRKVFIGQGFQQKYWNVLISKYPSSSTLMAFPIPFSNIVNLKSLIENKIPLSIYIFDVKGSLVHNSKIIFNNNRATLNLADLSNGHYLLIVKNNSIYSSIKLIKK